MKKRARRLKNEIQNQKSEGMRLNILSKTSRTISQRNSNINEINIFYKPKNYKKKSKPLKIKSILKNNKEKCKIKNIQNYNDKEINSLDYEKALVLDKRTYFQYYCALIKIKHLIAFTFCYSNDYNIMTIKISLFLLTFELYLTINGFFFSDDTMHKIYEDKGNNNIIFQIPQIIYSSVISSIITVFPSNTRSF